MDFYFGLLQIIGVHTLLGLPAYVVLLTGQLSMAQVGFFAIGTYVAGMGTVLWGLHIAPALALAGVVGALSAFVVGFPALRVKGLMLVVATLAFSEIVRLGIFGFTYQVGRNGALIGPHGTNGFKQIRYFLESGWSAAEVSLFIWAIVITVMAALWWMDRSRAGAVLRAVGADETAAQSVGLSLTAVKVSAMTAGGFIAAIGGGLYAHVTTHVQSDMFNVLLATFAVAYPILGGRSNVFGTLFAVLFIQGFLIEGLRFLGEWRNLLFGLLILLIMNIRPDGILDASALRRILRLFGRGRQVHAPS